VVFFTQPQISRSSAITKPNFSGWNKECFNIPVCLTWQPTQMKYQPLQRISYIELSIPKFDVSVWKRSQARRAYSTHGRNKKLDTKFWSETLKGRDHSEDLEVGEMILE
jgi:hypothetical protein